MQSAREQKKEFFEEMGLQVVNGDVAVGQTYPLFGMITKILEQTEGKIRLELNFQIIANVSVDDTSRIDTLKERVFESGIFVSTVVKTEPQVEVNCQTIIFGRKQAHHA